MNGTFIVYNKESGLFLQGTPKPDKHYVGPRKTADYFPSEREAYAEVKWLQDNDYLPKESTFAAIPFDSTILQ